jgi:hypothetical protein
MTKEERKPTASEFIINNNLLCTTEQEAIWKRTRIYEELDNQFINKDDHVALKEAGLIKIKEIENKLNNLHDVFLLVNGKAPKEIIQSFREGESKGRETAIQQIKEELLGRYKRIIYDF